MISCRIWISLAVVLALCLVPPGVGGARQPTSDPEAVSPHGRLLFARAENDSTADAFSEVAAAQADFGQAGSDREFRAAALRLGRALDAVWRYREAVSVYSRGLSRLGEDGDLFLRRGTSLLRIRNFQRALDDLRRANRLLEGNYEGLYRYGLALFVNRDFKRSAKTLEQAVLVAASDDELIAALHWAYISNRWAGRRKSADVFLAQVPEQMDLQHNADYFLLVQMYFGRVGEYAVLNQEDAEAEPSSTRGFGVANWHLYIGGEARAREILTLVVESAGWPAIGVIAAEVDLERLIR